MGTKTTPTKSRAKPEKPAKPVRDWRAERRALLYKQGFLAVADAAKLAGVHFVTIYKALNRGDLTGTQYGKTLWVSVDSLAAWVPEGAVRQNVLLGKTVLPKALEQADALQKQLTALMSGQPPA